MFTFALILFSSLFLLPSTAFAWGPLTHVYLGNEVFFLGAAIPSGIYSIIRKYRQDYLYGNIMADIIFAKKYLPKEKNPHNWDVAFELMDDARTEPERAFALGYLSHLAADTVAHSRYTGGKKNIRHTFLELKAESRIDKHYWLMALSIDRNVQNRGDVLLKRCLESPIFSFKTNKRILKGIVLFSGLGKPPAQRLSAQGFSAQGLSSMFAHREDYGGLLEDLHEESLDRMLDLLQKGPRSKVLKKDPLGH